MSDKTRDSKERKAARASLKRAYKKKMRKERSFMSIMAVPVAIIMIAACAVSIIGDKIELNEKQAELAVLHTQAEELEAENAGYESILSEEDERTYMERIAIEKLGYAYPDERRFTTRN